MDLTGKVALITGATRGIGQAIALTFARHHAKLAIIGRNETRLAEVSEKIKQLDTEVLAYRADVKIFLQIQDAVNQTIEKFGALDILVNNAGIVRDNFILRMIDEEWNDVINTNLTGTYFGIKAVVKYMMKRRFGKIINITSDVGLAGNPGQVNYSASKAGIVGLTYSAAKELATKGVTVNSIAPGFIETSMTSRLSDSMKAQIIDMIPLKRSGTVQDVANLALFLASDLSNYITGQIIQVDGGLLIG